MCILLLVINNIPRIAKHRIPWYGLYSLVHLGYVHTVPESSCADTKNDMITHNDSDFGSSFVTEQRRRYSNRSGSKCGEATAGSLLRRKWRLVFSAPNRYLMLWATCSSCAQLLFTLYQDSSSCWHKKGSSTGGFIVTSLFTFLLIGIRLTHRRCSRIFFRN